ncbi:GIY-YIG nuclease family protein [Nocardioides sp.]|uniref:GIY-YIG nuclease family protein n=1 Tax=Nocardioides sp. TaxID=35761 RepID=UPI002638C2F8|nr:hypothetical protein [Nocardioides sp.]MDI6908931.1 hypothetical protein [Nocardioides sp.]
MAQEDEAEPVLAAIVHEAMRFLVETNRVPIADLAEQLKPVPGLYAVFGTDDAWKDLGLSSDDMRSRPLYVGKAEDSFVSRDLRTHFASGRTGQSTVRRSFAALLRDSLELRGAPRNLELPGHFANYGLMADGDARLTKWMWERLSLAVWPWERTTELKRIERAVVLLLDPPLNIEYLPRASRRDLSSARKAMADDARRWALDNPVD